ncbi:MAG: methyltransferase family protein [Limisphaerales bacterium]
MNRFYERGGSWVLVQSVLMPLVLALGPLSPGVDGPFWMRMAALVLLGLGAGIGVMGTWVLGRNRTIFPRPNDGSHLIQHGVYALIRHPLYSSVTLL